MTLDGVQQIPEESIPIDSQARWTVILQHIMLYCCYYLTIAYQNIEREKMLITYLAASTHYLKTQKASQYILSIMQDS